jgi:hypothetical protein
MSRAAVVSLTRAGLIKQAVASLETGSNVPGTTLSDLIIAGHDEAVRRHLNTNHTNALQALGDIKYDANDSKSSAGMLCVATVIGAGCTYIVPQISVFLAPMTVCFAALTAVDLTAASKLNKFVASEMKE